MLDMKQAWFHIRPDTRRHEPTFFFLLHDATVARGLVVLLAWMMTRWVWVTVMIYRQNDFICSIGSG